MPEIGETLREARMRRRIDVAEAEAATKIRAKYLRALENDEFAMLPGSTYVKSFLRTYAEHLGLDAQLLVEEYRAQHEPRGEGELQAYVPPARRERERGGGGPPAFGPGTLLAAGVVLLLIIFAVIGLASGDNNKKKSATKPAKHKRHKARRATPPPPRPKPAPTTVSLKIVPVESTYVCLDDGSGHKIAEDIVTSPQTYKAGRIRLNMGRSSAQLVVDGKNFNFTRTASAVGFEFSPGGKSKPLPAGQRPCGG